MPAGKSWLMDPQRLRYKDYQLASRPAAVSQEHSISSDIHHVGFFETKSVKDFGHQMQQRGVFALWRKAMGYASDDERL